MIGNKYGRLTVVRKTDKKRRIEFLYECLCSCGNTTYQTRQALEIGHVKSCGCLQKDKAARTGKAQFIDGTRPSSFTGKPSKNSSTGFLGVVPYKQSGCTKYKASLRYKGVTYSKKGFLTAEEAYEYRLELEKKYLPPELRHKKTPPTA